MDDLVKRADAIEAVYRKYPYNAEQNKCDEMVDALNALPSADTHEIRTETHECVKETHDTDLISRADAIAYIDRIINSGLGRNKSLNYIHKYISLLPSADAVSREFYEDAVKANIRLVMENRELKEQIESADAVQGWIPCSERLPSEDGCYLVSTTGTNNDIIDIAYYTEEIWHKASRIKAWMPLPKPYREESEDEE
jgi:hypothetical protein